MTDALEFNQRMQTRLGRQHLESVATHCRTAIVGCLVGLPESWLEIVAWITLRHLLELVPKFRLQLVVDFLR